METNPHNLQNLFRQLGLPGSPAEIDAFILAHRLPVGVALVEAAFWTSAQAAFLKQALEDDSDWAEAVDELAQRLA